MRIEENGPETCRVSNDKGFVLVRTPVRALGDAGPRRITFRYTVGGFIGRESAWPSDTSTDTILNFRVPRELFREGERFTAEVLQTDEQGTFSIIWSNKRTVHWVKETPTLEPLPDAGPPEPVSLES